MTIEIHPVTLAIGAEIRGVDLSKPLSNETVDTLRAALHAHLVLLFRNQKLTESDQIAFAGRFGPIQVPPLKTKYHDSPEINLLDQASPRGDGADNWHADHTYTKRPALYSLCPRRAGAASTTRSCARARRLRSPARRSPPILRGAGESPDPRSSWHSPSRAAAATCRS